MQANTTPNAATAVSDALPTAVQKASSGTTSLSYEKHWYTRVERYLLWLLLAIGSVIMIGPFYWMLVTSFKIRQEVIQYPPTWWPETFTWDNWQSLTELRTGSFVTFFQNSIFVASVITVLTLLLSSMTGYVFAKLPFPGRDRLFWLVLSMMMIPFTVSIIPSYALMVRFGWIDSYLALIIPIIFNPFGIFLMRQFMQSLPGDLLDAARIDGASEFRVFFQMVLPLSNAALAALGILTFLGQWDNFLWPLVILQSPEKYTVPLALAQFRGRMGTDVGPTAAASILAVIPVLIVYIIAQKKVVEGIALTGLKG